MASINDKITKASPRWSGKIGSSGVPSATATTIPLDSVSNLVDGEVYYFTINRVNSSGNKNTLADMETVKGILSGTNFINCIRGVEGTAQAWSAGTVVEVLFTATQWNSLKDWVEVEHNQDGTHGDITATSVSATGDVSGATVSTNTINEKTADSGVTVDGVLLKDGGAKTTGTLEVTGTRVGAIFDNGNVTGTVTIDWSKGDTQKITLTGNTTLSFSNVTAGAYLTLWVVQDATGGRTLAFPTGTKYAGGTVPTITTTANAIDIVGIRAYSANEYHVVAVTQDIK